MRRAVVALVLLLGSPGCRESSPDEVLDPVVPKPCAGVYGPAVDACVAETGCAGFGCFAVWDRCSADVKRGVLMDCCVANYATYDERMRCVDSLGTQP
jgi:hypothetical protein